MNLNSLETYAEIRNLLTNCEHSQEHTVSGFVELTQDNLDKLSSLVSDELCSDGVEIYKGEDKKADKVLSALSYTEKFSGFFLKVELPTKYVHSQYFICDSWNNLLSYSDYVLEPVEGVFIADDLSVHSDNSASELYKRYKNASKVCQLIQQVANDTNAAGDYLIIFGQSLSINFTLDDTALSHNIDPDSLEELLKRDLHKEAKTGLVREALVSFLKNIDKSKRFTYLLSHFNAFATQLLSSYEQYVSNYSFDKVRKEHQEKKTEYIAKINKVFDDVATKTLAIPAGVWLAVSKIEEGPVSSLIFFKNLTFILIVFVLALIVCFNLLGQFNSLSAIKNEYTPLFDRLSKEKGIDVTEIATLVTDLKNRETAVWWKLAASMLITIVMFILVIVLVVYATNN